MLVVVFLLGACGSLPRPFQPEDKAPSEALEAALGARAGVFIEPIAGLPESESAGLTAELVRALHQRDVAAGRHASNRASYIISARRQDSGVLAWALAAPGGVIVLQFEEAADEGSADSVAARFAAYLNPSEIIAPAGPPALTLTVRPVDGAPGDGRFSLTRAMRLALAAHGLESAESLENADFIVLGSVYVSAAADSSAHQSIAVDWTVLLPDGVRIGTVTQSNVLPKGALDGAWGAVARAVAENGAEGVIAMLERIGAFE